MKHDLDKKCIASLFFQRPDGELKLLASSASGHGRSNGGDLNRTPGLLSNRVWSLKVQHVARELKVNSRSNRDYYRHVAGTAEEKEGLAAASHNERKLTTFAVYWIYAHAHGIPFHEAIKKNLSRRDLLRLQGFTFSNGSRPQFLIVLRPPNKLQRACGPCRKFVSKVHKVTSFIIKLEAVPLREGHFVEPRGSRQWPVLPAGHVAAPTIQREVTNPPALEMEQNGM